MRILALIAQRARGVLVAAVACGLVGGITNIAFLALINARLASGVSTALQAFAFVGLAVIMLLSYCLSRLLLIFLLHRTIHDLRERLCRQVLGASLPRLEAVGSARLLATLTEDGAAITSALSLLPALCINSVIVCGTLIYLAVLSPHLLAVLLGLLLLAVKSYVMLDARAAIALRRAAAEMGSLIEDIEGVILGNRELKLHRPRRQALLSGHLLPHLAAVRETNIRSSALYAFTTSWGQTLVVLLVGVILFILPRFRAVGADVLSGFALGIIQLIGALGVLLESVPALRRAEIAMDKVEQLQRDIQAEQALVPGSRLPQAAWGRLELVGVTYTIDREKDTPFILGPIDLCFRPGEVVLITGGNGSGKTTLAKLIAGLYVPTTGVIQLDGCRIDPLKLDDYRQLFTACFTDGHVFKSLLGLNERRVKEQIERFELGPWVHVTEGAFSTTALSQGQRKRLLLTTALAEDRPFYIFDEWTANQDPPFRERFYQELLPELRSLGKAVVVITHDDRYHHLADALIQIDQGRIRHIRRNGDTSAVRPR